MLRTPFYNHHLEHKAKMVDFAGWEMPLLFTSIIEEHHQVRNHAGIFDVSHMGRINFAGRHARRFLERVLTRKVSDMPERACRYSLICNERGGVKDDVIVYRFDDHWMLVVNAANREKLLAHFDAVKADLAVKIEDATLKTGMVAVQGPEVMSFVSNFSREIPTLKRYAFTIKNLLILKMIVSRTGYTGEDGIEIVMPAATVSMAVKLLLKEDEKGDRKVKPIGLGARDTLRLEAGMPLYGHELTEDIDPLSAGLAFAVSLDKHTDTSFGDPERFIGQDALEKIAAEGPKRKLVGLKLEGRRTPRQHMPVLLPPAGPALPPAGPTLPSAGPASAGPVGSITSGTLSPTLNHPIAMAYVGSAHSAPGTKLSVDISGEPVGAEAVMLPFYKHP